MSLKSWQELLDAVTLEAVRIGASNRILSVKFQEDMVELCLNENVYRYVMRTNLRSKITRYKQYFGSVTQWKTGNRKAHILQPLRHQAQLSEPKYYLILNEY
jgi:hypothetical protein